MSLSPKVRPMPPPPQPSTKPKVAKRESQPALLLHLLLLSTFALVLNIIQFIFN